MLYSSYQKPLQDTTGKQIKKKPVPRMSYCCWPMSSYRPLCIIGIATTIGYSPERYGTVEDTICNRCYVAEHGDIKLVLT